MPPRWATLYKHLGTGLLLLVIVLNPWTLSLILPPSSRLLHLSSKLLVGALNAAALLVAMLLLLRNPAKLKKEIPNYALLFASLAVSVVLLELFLRFFTPTPIFHPDLALYPYRKVKLHPRLLGVSEEGLNTTNEWGMRGDPIPDDWDARYTILAIGGSTTQCYYLSDDNTWPARLQAELRKVDPTLMVQNAGLDGHSTRGHLLMMKKVVSRVRPDMVILLVGHNDLMLSLSKQTFLFGNSSEKSGVGYYIYCKSRLVQLLYKWFQVFVNKAPVVRATGLGPATGYQAQPLLHPTPLPEPLESRLPSLEEYRSNILRIIELARLLGVRPVFLTQPLLFEDTPYWNGIRWFSRYHGRQPYAVSAGTYARMLSIFNKNLLQICEEQRVSCFDLGAAIPHEQKYFYDATHFNDAGAALVATRWPVT
jgi:lysophospholipase L1-like esterase